MVSRQCGTEHDMALSVTWHCQHCRARLSLCFQGAPVPQALLQGPHPILGLLQGALCPLSLSEPLAPAKHHLAKSPAQEQKQRAPGRARELGEGAAPCTAPLQHWKPAGHRSEASPHCLCAAQGCCWLGCHEPFRGALVALSGWVPRGRVG